MVQKAAASLLFKTRIWDRMTPISASFASDHIRSDIKVLVMIHKIGNGPEALYLSDLIITYIPSSDYRAPVCPQKSLLAG